MTGVQWFNAGTIAVIVVAAVGLVRLQVAEWRATTIAARRAATAERQRPVLRLAPPPPSKDRATSQKGER